MPNSVKSEIDENNNFEVEFKNGQEIIELFFNKDREYYMSNAIAFVKNKNFTYGTAALNLETIAKRHLSEKKFSPPFAKQIAIDYSQEGLTTKYYKKYAYKLDTSKIQTYIKKYKYFNTDTKKVQEFKVYDVISHMKAGVIYKASDTDSLDVYSEMNFKLTTGRKIEIKLAASANSGLRIIYYQWINTIFRKNGSIWKKSDNGWVVPALNVYKREKRRGENQAAADFAATRSIFNYFKNKPTATVFMNGQSWEKLDSDSKFFTSLAITGEGSFINTNAIRHNLYVPLQSNFYLKRSSNLFKNFRYVRIISPGKDFYDSFYNVPFNKLAKFEINGIRHGTIRNCYRINEDMKIETKIFELRENIFTTNTFYGASHEKTISEAKMNELLKLNNYEKAVKDVDFKNIKTIKKPSEHAYFLYENQNIIKETFISEINKRVSLLGGVWYFVKTGSDGKIEIVTSKNKLRFKIKKNESLSKFNFNISPVTAAKKN